MKKMLIVNHFKCTGCGLCRLNCSVAKESVFELARARIHIHIDPHTGFSTPTVCLQCEDAWCQDACAADAIDRNLETGALIINEEQCTGCQECVSACPYGCIEFNHADDIALKCDLCNGDPKCVEMCYPNAIRVIDYQDVI